VRTVDEHLAGILGRVGPLTPLTRPLEQVSGCVLAEDVVSTGAVPSFANSSMDGYALRAADVAAATEGSPVVLPVAGEIAAGSSTRSGS